jgi:hypothetical protein
VPLYALDGVEIELVHDRGEEMGLNVGGRGVSGKPDG